MQSEENLKNNRTENFSDYLARFKSTLRTVFHEENDINQMSIQRGIEPQVLQKIMECNPMSFVIPTQYGGRGGNVSQNLQLLSAASYE